jgi:hypothetical protein
MLIGAVTFVRWTISGRYNIFLDNQLLKFRNYATAFQLLKGIHENYKLVGQDFQGLESSREGKFGKHRSQLRYFAKRYVLLQGTSHMFRKRRSNCQNCIVFNRHCEWIVEYVNNELPKPVYGALLRRLWRHCYILRQDLPSRGHRRMYLLFLSPELFQKYNLKAMI